MKRRKARKGKRMRPVEINKTEQAKGAWEQENEKDTLCRSENTLKPNCFDQIGIKAK